MKIAHTFLLISFFVLLSAGCRDDGADNDPFDSEDDSDGAPDADTDGDTDGDTDTDSDSDSDSDSDGDNGPETACHSSAEGWPTDWAEMETQVLTEVNAHRIAGDSCEDSGGNIIVFDPLPPLTMEPHLHCAARVHSRWMAENETMTHNSPGGPIGDTPSGRLSNAGYTGQGWSENIAMGYGTPEAVVDSWMHSAAGHCTAIMGDYELIGVGYAFTETGQGWGGDYWTLDFGN